MEGKKIKIVGEVKGYAEIDGQRYPIHVQGIGEAKFRKILKDKHPDAKLHIEKKRCKRAKNKKKKK